MDRVSADVAYFRRVQGNFTANDNLDVTAADFDPYCVTAPTDSRLPSDVSGKQICGLYDISPTKFGLPPTTSSPSSTPWAVSRPRHQLVDAG